jgi:hypothetical protein
MVVRGMIIALATFDAVFARDRLILPTELFATEQTPARERARLSGKRREHFGPRDAFRDGRNFPNGSEAALTLVGRN